MQSSVRVAAVQAASKFADVESNIERFVRLVTSAAEAGARIVVLPEAALTGYTSQDFASNWHVKGRKLARQFNGVDPESHAQTLDGSIVETFCALSKKLGIYVSVPFVEKEKLSEDTYRYYNTVILASPTGAVAGHYRKVNLWPYVDQSWAHAGRSLCVVDTEYGRVGLGICFDVHVIFDLYKPHNLWCLLYSIAWVDGDEDQSKEWFDSFLPEQRVKKLGAHTVAANWSTDKPQPSWSGQGYSRIYDRNGRVLARAKDRVGDEILYADLPVATAEAPPVGDLSVNLYETKESADSTGQQVVQQAATREEEPRVRPWEWHLLEAISKDDEEMLKQACERHRSAIDRLTVGESIGDKWDRSHFYYRVGTFGLKWQLKDTAYDLAVRNGKAIAVKLKPAADGKEKEEPTEREKALAQEMVAYLKAHNGGIIVHRCHDLPTGGWMDKAHLMPFFHKFPDLFKVRTGHRVGNRVSLVQ